MAPTIHYVSEGFHKPFFVPFPIWTYMMHTYIYICVLTRLTFLNQSLLTSIAPHRFPLLSLHVYVCNEKYICSLASKGFPFVVKRSDPHSLQYTSFAPLGICIISFLKSHQSTFSLIIVSFGNIPLCYHIFN